MNKCELLFICLEEINKPELLQHLGYFINLTSGHTVSEVH